MSKRFHISLAGVLSVALLLLLAATSLEPPMDYHFQQPYKPIRVWKGMASWYGPRFQGQPTASGQPYDMNAATAAHLHLPFGSVVLLVDLSTGRSQIVRINDRGPYVAERELDVSYFVANKLGLIGRGVDPVRIELLEEPHHP